MRTLRHSLSLVTAVALLVGAVAAVQTEDVRASGGSYTDECTSGVPQVKFLFDTILNRSPGNMAAAVFLPDGTRFSDGEWISLDAVDGDKPKANVAGFGLQRLSGNRYYVRFAGKHKPQGGREIAVGRMILRNAEFTGLVISDPAFPVEGHGDGKADAPTQANLKKDSLYNAEITAPAGSTKGTFNARVTLYEDNFTIGYRPVNCPPPPPPPSKGCIEILKETFNTQGQPITPVAQFTFTLDGNRTTQNNATGYAVFQNVPAGHHNVTELVPDGWVLLSVTPENGYVYVEPGAECAAVVFKNQQRIPPQTPPQCSDGIDNDGDYKIDYFDPGCYPNNVFDSINYNPNDNDERNSQPNPNQCSWLQVHGKWVRKCH